MYVHSFTQVTRLKSSVVTKTFNPSQTKFANVTNILTEENPFIIGRHEKPKVDRTAEVCISILKISNKNLAEKNSQNN